MKRFLRNACLIACVAISMHLLPSSVMPRASAFSATVSGTNMQTVKGWGVHAFDSTVAAPITQAFCVDLGMTMGRITVGSGQSSDDQGNINTGAMDSSCIAISNYASHGISYIMCSWSPNAGMKNPAINSTADLRTDHEGNFTTWWVNMLTYIKNKGLPLPVGVCVQNEPTTVANYDNMHFVNENNFDYSQYYRVIKDLRNKLNANGLSAVKIIGPEDGSYDTGNNWGCSLAFLGGNGFPALSADSSLASALGGFSSHSYNWGGGVGYLQQWASSCETWGKDKWMTEYSYIENGENNTPGIDVAVMGARRLISDMACVRNNYWLWWDGYNPGTPINEVLMADDGVTKYPLFYVLSTIFKNAPVGSIARRVSSTDPNMHTADDIWMDGVAFVNGNSTEVVLVNSSNTTASTTSVNGLTGTTANVYQTTSSQNMALVSSPAVSGGTISTVNMPAWSVTVIVTSGANNTSGPAAVNAGGPTASPFLADADFSGGTAATNWTGTIDTSAVTSSAPQAVYQSERYGSPAMSYTFPGLTPNASYKVRLHFCENYVTASGQRTFNVSLNGASVLSNFDIFATTGALHKANIQQFTANANASGQMVIAFTNVVNSALVNGIEVQVNSTPPPTPTGLTATAGNGQALLSWNASTGATSYNLKRSTVSGSGYATISSSAATSYLNTGLTNGTTYYYVVSAVNAGGESANSGQASATPVAAPQAQIANAATAPVIDGNNTDAVWSSATSYSINNVGGTVSSSADLTGSYKAAWDTTNLYLLVDVTDDVKVNDSTNPWDDDAVELFLDADHNGGTVYDANDRQYVFGWNDATVVEAGGRSATGVTFAKADPTGTTYRIEAKVPWSTLAFTATANAIIGIDVQVDDDDDNGARDGYKTWNDTTGQGWTNPSVFGTGKLVAGGTPPPSPTGLTGVPGNAQVALAWNASSGATSYNVLRSTVSGSGYAQVVNQAGTSYTNTGLTNGTQYYFVVQAVSSGGTSGNGNQAAAKPVLAPAFVQVNSNDPVSAASIAVAYSSAQTAGNLNIVVVGWNDTTSTVSSVVDSLGNTYILAVGPTTGGGQRQSIYYAKNIKGGSNTVTVTMSTTVNYPDIRVSEYTGVGALDVTAAAFGTSTAPNSGSATTTTARELIFSANTCYPATTAPGPGFTTRVTTIDGDITEDKAVTATGGNSGSATLGASNFWVMQMATFK